MYKFCISLLISLFSSFFQPHFAHSAMEEPLLSQDALYSSLKDKFYVKVPFSVDKSAIEEAKNAFFDFLNQPESIKTHIQFKLSNTARRSDVGYQHRQDDDGQFHDNKDFFHFHPAVFEKYPDFLDKNPVVKNFMEKALPLWAAVYKTIHSLLTTIDQKHPGVVDKVFNTPYPHIILRFLKYSSEKPGETLAKAHFDAGSFTLALAESGPGLRIGSCPDNLSPLHHEDQQAVFMLGVNVHQLIKDDQLLPGWHDVIQLDRTLIGQPWARWAIVAFIDAQGIEGNSRQETHKWSLKK